MSNDREPTDTPLLSPAVVGVCMIVAAVVSLLVYVVNGHWAAGQGGLMTAGFGIAGAALLGAGALQDRR